MRNKCFILCILSLACQRLFGDIFMDMVTMFSPDLLPSRNATVQDEYEGVLTTEEEEDDHANEDAPPGRLLEEGGGSDSQEDDTDDSEDHSEDGHDDDDDEDGDDSYDDGTGWPGGG